MLKVVLLFLVVSLGVADRIKIGFMPYLSAQTIHDRYTPLADHLSWVLDRPVRIVVARNHAHQAELFKKGAIDVAFLGGNPYVRIVEAVGPQPILARFAFGGAPHFRSVIIVREDSPLTALEQLQNKRIALGDPHSTLSSEVPLDLLYQAGLEADDLASITHLSNHENILYGVLFGAFEAGAVAEEIFMENRHRGLRALSYSEPLSTHLFIAHSSLEDADVRAIKERLLTLHQSPQGQRILRAIHPNLSGFVPGEDSDYDAHRAILKRLP